MLLQKGDGLPPCLKNEAHDRANEAGKKERCMFFTSLLATFHHVFARWFQGICYRPYDNADPHPGGKHKGGEGEVMLLLRRSAKWRIRDAQECIKVEIFGTRLGMQGL